MKFRAKTSILKVINKFSENLRYAVILLFYTLFMMIVGIAICMHTHYLPLILISFHLVGN